MNVKTYWLRDLENEPWDMLRGIIELESARTYKLGFAPTNNESRLTVNHVTKNITFYFKVHV